MSPELERLIGRAVIDKKFRKDLLDDPDGAIASSGLSLTPEEIAQVKAAAGERKKNRAGTDQTLDAAKGGAWS